MTSANLAWLVLSSVSPQMDPTATHYPSGPRETQQKPKGDLSSLCLESECLPSCGWSLCTETDKVGEGDDRKHVLRTSTERHTGQCHYQKCNPDLK